MGNRAVIAFEDKSSAVGIYLHWNGGRDSVEGFLKAARNLGFLERAGDKDYLLARLTQLIANYFGGMTGIGVGILKNLDCDNGNNGLYIVSPDTLEIVGRRHFKGTEQNEYKLDEMAKEVMEKNVSNFTIVKVIV